MTYEDRLLQEETGRKASLTVPKRLTKAQRISTAYHEAGHAVMRHSLGTPVAKVSLYDPPVDNLWGEVIGETFWGEANDAAMISAAGIVAESLLEGRETPYRLTLKLIFSKSNDDFKQIRETFLYEHDVDEEEFRRSFEWEAIYTAWFYYVSLRVQNEYLKPQWCKVQEIANALLRTGEVSGELLGSLLSDEDDAESHEALLATAEATAADSAGNASSAR